MAADLSWLIGRTITSIEKKDHTWFFRFDDTSTILTEGFWRLVTERVRVASEDDGHMFGLKAPVSSAARASEAITQSHIIRFALDERTGDLTLNFDNGSAVQFLTTSCGYEGWRTGHGDQCVICLGGGALAVFEGKRKS